MYVTQVTILHVKPFFRWSLESPGQGNSNEDPHHSKNKQNFPLIIIKNKPFISSPYHALGTTAHRIGGNGNH